MYRCAGDLSPHRIQHCCNGKRLNYTQYELYGTPLKMGHLVRIVEISAKMRDMISWREKIMENLKKYENEKGNRT